MKIVIKNFKCFRDETFTIPEGLIHLDGPSGSGKSTILTAVEWCLYFSGPTGILRKKPVVTLKLQNGVTITRDCRDLTVVNSDHIMKGAQAESWIETTFGKRIVWEARQMLKQKCPNNLITASNIERFDILYNMTFTDADLPGKLIAKSDAMIKDLERRLHDNTVAIASCQRILPESTNLTDTPTDVIRDMIKRSGVSITGATQKQIDSELNFRKRFPEASGFTNKEIQETWETTITRLRDEIKQEESTIVKTSSFRCPKCGYCESDNLKISNLKTKLMKLDPPEEDLGEIKIHFKIERKIPFDEIRPLAKISTYDLTNFGDGSVNVDVCRRELQRREIMSRIPEKMKSDELESLKKFKELVTETSYSQIQHTIQNLELRINSILKKLFENPINVCFKIQRTARYDSLGFEIDYRKSKLTKPVSELSGGELERLSIAVTLAMADRNQILFIDESMSALDGDSREKCLNVLKESGQNVLNICHTTVKGFHDFCINAGLQESA